MSECQFQKTVRRMLGRCSSLRLDRHLRPPSHFRFPTSPARRAFCRSDCGNAVAGWMPYSWTNRVSSRRSSSIPRFPSTCLRETIGWLACLPLFSPHRTSPSQSSPMRAGVATCFADPASCRAWEAGADPARCSRAHFVIEAQIVEAHHEIGALEIGSSRSPGFRCRFCNRPPPCCGDAHAHSHLADFIPAADVFRRFFEFRDRNRQCSSSTAVRFPN